MNLSMIRIYLYGHEFSKSFLAHHHGSYCEVQVGGATQHIYMPIFFVFS